MAKRKRTSIRVGQRLWMWDGTPGYVALTSNGQWEFGPGETFLVEWTDPDDRDEVIDSSYLTMEQFETEGITWGRGLMPWAR